MLFRTSAPSRRRPSCRPTGFPEGVPAKSKVSRPTSAPAPLLRNCTSGLGVTDPETRAPGPDAYPCTGYWLPTAGRPWGIPMTSTRAAGRAPTLQRTLSAHASDECSLLFTPAKMAGIPNPYFQLIISNSRPGKARFRAKAVNTNSNREIPPTIREVTNIRPKIP